jgi:EAL and modified HD-GYP domain-containing signal transduction protein
VSQGAFVGRQPIVDRDRRVVAYELLFRSSRTAQRRGLRARANLAALRVIANTFATLGEEAVLGGHLGFFNVTREVLLADAIFALPKERVVVELLEDIEPDQEVADALRGRCAKAGYRIALDDWVPERSAALRCSPGPTW